VTDFLGRLVAATDRNARYYNALEDWWKETYADGRDGAVFIGDVHYDKGSGSFLIDIAQPFVEPETGVIGVIKTVQNIQRLNGLLGSVQAGPGTTVSLIRAKGDVISATGYSSLQWANFPGTLGILTAREKGKKYFISTEAPQTIYGVSQRSFPQLYRT